MIGLQLAKSNCIQSFQNPHFFKKFFYFWSKSKIIEKLFYYIVAFSYLLLPLGYFISRSKKSETVPVALAVYGIICCTFLFCIRNKIIPKELWGYFQISYTFFEYAVFTLLFWTNIRQKQVRRLIVIASVLFFTFLLFYVLIAKVKRLDTVPIGIETILILTYIIYFFYEFSKDSRNFYIYNHYCFWIAVGILIYLGGSFFFFILFNQLSNDQIETFGNLTYLAEIIKNILFALSIFIYHRYSLENNKEKTSSLPYLDMT